MTRLHELIGREHGLGTVSNALRQFAQDLGAAAVGAYQVHCSDEAERECGEDFQRWFVRELLPELEPDFRAPMRTVNLGARYEFGAIQIAEDHYATAPTRDGFKLLTVKLNTHVGVTNGAAGPEYGQIDRYGRSSTCCGALAAVFGVSTVPAVDELRATLRGGGLDRLTALADPTRVEPRHRALLAAVANAALQARRIVDDARRHKPSSPTVYLVLPCVTVNRPGPDTELVVGQYGIDRTEGKAQIEYRGLGDDPTAYRVAHGMGQLTIADGQWPGRDISGD